MKKPLMFQRYSMLFVLALTASACGKGKPGSPSSSDQPFQLEGSLTENIESLRGNPNAESCEKEFEVMRSELANALDRRADQIQKQSGSLLKEGESLIDFHGSQLISKPLKKVEKKGWREDRISWKTIYEMFKKDPQSADPEFWAKLNKNVRGLLTDDVSRIKYARNYYLKRTDFEKVKELKALVDPCASDKTCLEIQFPSELEAFIAGIPSYRKQYSKMKKAKFDGDFRNALDELNSLLYSDSNRQTRYNNLSIKADKSSGKTVLTVPFLTPRLTTEERELLKKHFEERWESAEIKVKAEFLDKGKDVEAFSLFLDNDPGGRAYVYQWNREMHLLPLTDTRVLAHEFGHVLGFKDHYYTRWDPAQCGYIDEYTEEDIMSDHRSGQATAEEFEWLKTNYVDTPTAKP